MNIKNKIIINQWNYSEPGLLNIDMQKNFIYCDPIIMIWNSYKILITTQMDLENDYYLKFSNSDDSELLRENEYSVITERIITSREINKIIIHSDNKIFESIKMLEIEFKNRYKLTLIIGDAEIINGKIIYRENDEYIFLFENNKFPDWIKFRLFKYRNEIKDIEELLRFG